MKTALVISSMGDGDSSFSFVDEERWNQIFLVHSTWPHWGKKDQRLGALVEIIGWLLADDLAETDIPKGAPAERIGKLLGTWYIQNWVVEPCKLFDVAHILTLP